MSPVVSDNPHKINDDLDYELENDVGFFSNLVTKANGSLIAKRASSEAAFQAGQQLASHTRASVEQYFTQFGSTAKKFEYNSEANFYFGYVSTPERGEFLSVVVMNDAGCVACSFLPPIDQGQDFLGLMAKKEFADQVALTFVQAARHGKG